MNDLSLFLYLIDFLSKVGTAAGAVLILSLFLVIVLNVGRVMTTDHDEKEATKKALKWTLVGLLVTSVIAIVIPSPKTMYMIAASEVGEEVVMSDSGQKAIGLLIDKLEGALNEETEENPSEY